MNDLFKYVSALHEENVEFSIAEQVLRESTAIEDGIFVESSELVVQFENGVTLKRQIERDHADRHDDDVCSEYWISYEVVSQPISLDVMPKKKTFTNRCQEAFWLKMNKIQSNT